MFSQVDPDEEDLYKLIEEITGHKIDELAGDATDRWGVTNG